MKKKLSLVLFALICSTATFAQISYNVKAGMNMSNHMNDEGANMKLGYQVGVGMEYGLTNIWSVQPSLMFTTKGAKYSEAVSGVEVDVTMNQMYLELPIMAAARLNISGNTNIVLSAGPYLAYGVGGKTKAVAKLTSGKLTAKGEEEMDTFGDNGLNRFDAGLGFGACLELGSFLVSLNGELGLAKLDSEKDSPKNINFAVGVGYKF